MLISDSAPVLARPPASGKRIPKVSVGPETQYANMARALIHAGLFYSLETRAPGQTFNVLYTTPSQNFRFSGPELLGVHDMRVLAGLVAIACLENPSLPARLQPKTTDVPEAADPCHVELISIRTTYNQLALEIGHMPNSGSALNSIKASVRRLCATNISVQNTDVSPLQSIEAEPILRELSVKRRRKGLEVMFCSELSAAIRRVPGKYLRVDMPEIRAISKDVARLVHMRLHWINQGNSAPVGLEKLVSYVYHGEARSDSSSHDRETKVLEALSQLKAQLKWGVDLVGASYQIRRPSAPPPRDQNTRP